MYLGGVARDGLHSFKRQLRAAEAAVAGVEVFVAIGGHVGFGHFAALGVGDGGFGDVHALTDAVGYAANFFAGSYAIGRYEIDVGEEDVSCEIATFQQEAGSDPTA